MEKTVIDQINKIEKMMETLSKKLETSAASLTKEGLDTADKLVDNTLVSFNSVIAKLESELIMDEAELEKLNAKCQSICDEVCQKIDELPHIEIAKFAKKDDIYLDDVKNFVNVVVNKSKEVFTSDECQKLVNDTKDGVINVLEKGLDVLKDILDTK